jgi:hypothetical protein
MKTEESVPASAALIGHRTGRTAKAPPTSRIAV